MRPLRVGSEAAVVLSGSIRVPSDKSITQRALLLAAVAEGVSVIRRPLRSADPRAVAAAIQQLGARIEDGGEDLRVTGVGARGFLAPTTPLDLGNSGTGARLLLGLLAGRRCTAEVTGDASLRSRPMGRVVRPLERMGARFAGARRDTLPLRLIASAGLQPFRGALEVASAQVKSAILFAALGADGESEIVEPQATRDHSERLLPEFGVPVAVEGATVRLAGPAQPRAASVEVPGDPSSAAPLAAAAALCAGSEVSLPGVCGNPRRREFFRVLAEMGADVHEEELPPRSGERVVDLRVRARALRGLNIDGSRAAALIDELPLVAVLACFAEGETRIEGAAELRVKESDRIEVLAAGLRAMGGQVTTYADGLCIRGPQHLRGAALSTAADHRMAMAFSIAALAARQVITLDDQDAVAVSYPPFFEHLEQLAGRSLRP